MGKTNFFSVCREVGPLRAVWRVALRVRYKTTLDYQILKRRRQLSSRIEAMFGATIAYGPFKGLRLPANNWWGVDRAAMYFGLYEQEILASLANLPDTYRTLVDLGAAEGYYGIGAVASRLFDRSYCFEQSVEARGIILESAKLNGVSDRISIHGTADRDFYEIIPAAERSKSVLLVDIEGGEFDLLTEDVFRAFERSIIFIELHDYAFRDGRDRLATLKASAGRFFNITELTTTARDLSKFPELRSFSDTDRWLICSEGRGRLMQWLRLDPKLAFEQ
jgi:hypothetical protein